MKNLNTLLSRKDSQLTEDQWKFMDNLVVKAARAKLQARRVFGSDVLFLNDPSKIHVEWSEQTGMSKASISLMGEDDTNEDTIDRKNKLLRTKVIEKGWKLPWRFSTLSELEAELVAEAGEQVAITEDEHVATGLDGDKGLLNATGILTFAGNSWAAAGAAGWEARVNDVVEAIGKLEDKGHYGPTYQLIVNPAQAKVQRKVTENAGGSAIKELETALGGPVSERVVSWAKCPAGKAYLREVGSLNARLVVGLDLRNIELPKIGKSVRGQAIEIIATQIRRPASICEITGLT